VRILPTDRALSDYYDALKAAHAQGAEHEGNVRNAFERLLETTARGNGWTLVSEHSDTALTGRGIRYDGVLRDEFRLPHGWWEAKDSADDLAGEIRRKIARGYTLKNTIFEDTRAAVLYQDGREATRADLRQPDQLANLLSLFYSHTIAPFDNFEEAVHHFANEIPHVAAELNQRIQTAHANNKKFQKAFEVFYALCQSALNPNLRREAVDEMLIQHMLTERLIVKVFDVEYFTNSNVIAHEIQKVITALTSRHFNYRDFLGALDRFYDAIETAADSLATFSEKQAFLDNVYERFFQGYAVKVADTHGIVYTPQPIVDFMCAAVEEVLRDEFGLALGDPGVNIIDPATGTGNFIVNLLRRMPPQNLKRAYQQQLFANEVMLLPYYVASLNIEHAYLELTGEYEPFEGICFVDTLDLAKDPHYHQEAMSFMNVENAQRVNRQKDAEMMVIIGNPPYNVGQLNENDNNKNRKYDVIDRRVAQTYAKDSRASNKNALYDAYVKFFRWATDRLGDRDGIVCYVTNNSFVDQLAFDGMRKNLLQDFTRIYHLDLHGNVRQNPKLSGTTHNVFGIQVGVGITVAIRSSKHTERKLFYSRVPEFWTKNQKLDYLADNVALEGRKNSLNTVHWQEVQPNESFDWIVPDNAEDFASFIPIASRETKSLKGLDAEAIFKIYSMGLQSNRDMWVYDFDVHTLSSEMARFIQFYNSELDRWKRAGKPADVDDFVSDDDTKIKWSSSLKQSLRSQQYVDFSDVNIRSCLYRPFTKQYLYYHPVVIHRPGLWKNIFPTPHTEDENRVICCVSHSQIPFIAHIADSLADEGFGGRHTECLPFYVYAEDGSDRQENITDWALAQYQTHYADHTIGKWDIFYYVYGLLHHPGYRTKYAGSLKRELPRIPFAPDFWAFSESGFKLAELHLYYDAAHIVAPYPLEYQWTPDKRPDWRVEKMRLSKDKMALTVNDTLTLAGIPPETFDYRLGNRSALEWVVDQYRVKTDARSNITSDPNRADDEQAIVDLVRQVVAVSVETVRLVAALPAFE